MSLKHHFDDVTRGRLIGKLEEGRKTGHVIREFNIAHSIVFRLWAEFQKSGMCTRRTGTGHSNSITPIEDRYNVISRKRNRRSVDGELANQLCSAT